MGTTVYCKVLGSSDFEYTLVPFCDLGKSNFIYIYIISSAINVIAAYTILSGDRLTKFGFKVGIIMMLSLDYLAFRFRYETKVRFFISFRPKNLHFEGPEWPLRILDVSAAFGTISTVFGSWYISYLLWVSPSKNAPRILALGPLFGSIGLLMMSIYPMHMALGGDQGTG